VRRELGDELQRRRTVVETPRHAQQVVCIAQIAQQYPTGIQFSDNRAGIITDPVLDESLNNVGLGVVLSPVLAFPGLPAQRPTVEVRGPVGQLIQQVAQLVRHLFPGHYWLVGQELGFPA
jgi:hypothetical protein